jgi:hypothetical protein
MKSGIPPETVLLFYNEVRAAPDVLTAAYPFCSRSFFLFFKEKESPVSIPLEEVDVLTATLLLTAF